MKKLNLLLLAFLVVMGVTLQSCDDSDGYSLGDVAVDCTLDITVTGNGSTKARTLTAPLYSSGGIGGKKHYGFLRNHSYQVISTINTSALQLEDVTVEMRDWNDRPSVDIPEFK